MTWMTTWPVDDVPQYESHDTESQAEDHAAELVRSQRARVATVFECHPEAEATS